MSDKTKFKEVRVNTTSNGFSIFFKDYVGEFTTKNWFVAEDLEGVKNILAENLLAPKDF